MQPPDQPSPGEPNPAPIPPPSSPNLESAGEPVSKEERTWAMVAHLSTLLGYLLIPFANVIAPLVIWLIKKDTMPFAADQAKESLNFQITVTIALIVGAILIVFCVGWFLVVPAALAGIIYAVIAAIKANDGIRYRYPFSIRLVK